MDKKEFRAKINAIHKNWVASLFSLEPAATGDLDLVNGVVAVKLRCHVEKKKTQFKVSKHQNDTLIQAYADRDFYWALMGYQLKGRPEEASEDDLESRVLGRRLWLVPGKTLRERARLSAKDQYLCDGHPLVGMGYQWYERENALIYVPPSSPIEVQMVKQRLK